MKFQTEVLAANTAFALFFLSNAAAENGLRAAHHHPPRDQIVEPINDVMTTFVPILSTAIQTSLGAAELGTVDEMVDLGDVDYGPCKAASSLGYSFGALKGLDSFQIRSWELVPGTGFWTRSGLLGLGQASWEGTWVFKATFEDLSLETFATIQTTGSACGNLEIRKSVGGSMVLENPTLDLQMNIGGTRPNLFLLGVSVADSIDLQDSTFAYDTMVMNLSDGFGAKVDFDVPTFLKDTVVTNLNDHVIPQMMETIQNNLGMGLDFNSYTYQ